MSAYNYCNKYVVYNSCTYVIYDAKVRYHEESWSTVTVLSRWTYRDISSDYISVDSLSSYLVACNNSLHRIVEVDRTYVQLYYTILLRLYSTKGAFSLKIEFSTKSSPFSNLKHRPRKHVIRKAKALRTGVQRVKQDKTETSETPENFSMQQVHDKSLAMLLFPLWKPIKEIKKSVDR